MLKKVWFMFVLWSVLGVKRTHGSKSRKGKSCGGCSAYPLWQGKEGI